MHPFHCFAFFIILLLTSCIVLAKDKSSGLKISLSAPKHIEALLAKYFVIPEKPLVDETAQSTFIRRGRREIADLLATEGYFTPTITVKIQPQKKQLAIQVDPGPQAMVSKVSIEFQGDLSIDEPKQQSRIKQLRDLWLLKKGKPFRSSKWEHAKAELLSEVTHVDYPAAYIVKSHAIVDPGHASVQLSIHIDSGPAFYFGDLVISGLERYDETELNISNFALFRTGDPYQRDLLLAFQTELQNLPLLNSVAVNIDLDTTIPQAAPVNVVISEKQSKHFAIGSGFSSNNGARGELNYRDHNFLSQAWNMNTTLRLEQKRQTFFFGIDTLPDERNARYNFDARLQRTDIKDLETINQRVSFSRQFLTKNSLQQYGISWQQEEKRPSGGINQTNRALALNWRWRYHQIDDPVNIRNGNVTDLRVSGGIKQVLSDQDFLYTYARQQFWWPIGKRDVLYLRGEAGYTLAQSRFGIPQEFLFRAGGIQSIRGYDFLSQGVREGNAIVGGRTMATGTLEYTNWFLQNWGAAFFYRYWQRC